LADGLRLVPGGVGKSGGRTVVKVDGDGSVVPATPLDESDDSAGEMVPWEVAACRYYATVGNIAATARRYHTTVYEIKKLMSTAWWQDESARIKKEALVLCDLGYTQLIDKSIEQLNDRLDHGEIESVKYDEDGNVVSVKRKPLTSFALTRINELAFVKRQLIRNEPTAIPGESGALTVLAQKLRALGAKDPTIVEMLPDETKS
jgi:hypothetical protein